MLIHRIDLYTVHQYTCSFNNFTTGKCVLFDYWIYASIKVECTSL